MRRRINRRRKNEHCCYSVKGDAQAVTYVAACAIVSVFREKS